MAKKLIRSGPGLGHAHVIRRKAWELITENIM